MDFSLTGDQLEVLDACRAFAEKKVKPKAAEIDQTEAFPKGLFEEMGRLGLLGITIPEAYGGTGRDFVSASLVTEEISKASGGLALSYGAHAFLCATNVYSLGSEAQRKRYLPRLCSGEAVGAFVLTEPEAGSDSTAIKTSAEPKDGHYLLNGSKTLITNGTVADTFLVFARTPRKPGSQGISAFIVERGFPGFASGRDIPKLGTRGSPLSELLFTDCRVPRENLVGQEGAGLTAMLRCLDTERALLSGMAVGLAQAAFDYALRYATQRRAFKRPIASFQLVQEMLSQMAVEIEAARLLTRQACWTLDQGRPVTRPASFAKLFGAQMALRVTQQAVQVLGGYGFCREFPVERFYRDAALIGIGGGTNEIQKVIIARDLVKQELRTGRRGAPVG